MYRAVFIFIANIMPTLMACSIFVVYSKTAPIGPDGLRTPLTTALALTYAKIYNNSITIDFLPLNNNHRYMFLYYHFIGAGFVSLQYICCRTLALLNILRLPFILIPFAVGSFVSGKACAQRITKFLNAPELTGDAIE